MHARTHARTGLKARAHSMVCSVSSLVSHPGCGCVWGGGVLSYPAQVSQPGHIISKACLAGKHLAPGNNFLYTLRTQDLRLVKNGLPCTLNSSKRTKTTVLNGWRVRNRTYVLHAHKECRTLGRWECTKMRTLGIFSTRPDRIRCFSLSHGMEPLFWPSWSGSGEGAVASRLDQKQFICFSNPIRSCCYIHYLITIRCYGSTVCCLPWTNVVRCHSMIALH